MNFLNLRNYWWFLTLFLGAGLVISVWLNLQLFDISLTYYRQLNQARLNPLSLSQYPTPPMNTLSTQKNVVFLGDSRAFEWPAPDTADFRFINRGIGAQTTAQVLLRYEAHVTPIQPDILIVQVGINDLKTVPLFPERQAQIIADTEKHITAIVNRAVTEGSLVILTTIFPVGEVPLARQIIWSDEITIAVEQVNETLRGLASDRVLILDSHARLVNPETGLIQTRYARDVLHLNPDGYAQLNQTLLPLLHENR